MQNELFDCHDATEPLAIVTRDGHVEYFNHFYDADESDHLYRILLNSLPWEMDEIKMFGKLVKTARKVVWVGDPECAYTYSGVQKTPQAWTNELLQMKHKLEQFIMKSILEFLLRWRTHPPTNQQTCRIRYLTTKTLQNP